MKKLTLALLALAPALLWADTKILIDAIPSGAEFVGTAPMGIPFKDAEKMDPKEIESGLNEAVAGILPTVTKQGLSYVCLLTVPGDRPIAVPIHAAKATLLLSRTNTVIHALFYRGGHEATAKIAYSTGKPEEKTAHISGAFEKISLPKGATTAGWIYFNLPRLQAEAEKNKSKVIFVSTKGEGQLTAVPLPGLKEPLMVPEGKTVFTATWYMSPEIEATMRQGEHGEILGHPVPKTVPEAKK